MVYVEGNLQSREWGSSDGNRHKIYEIIATNLILMPNGDKGKVREKDNKEVSGTVKSDDDDVFVPED